MTYSRPRYNRVGIPDLKDNGKVWQNLGLVQQGIPWPSVTVDIRDFLSQQQLMGKVDATTAFQVACQSAHDANGALYLSNATILTDPVSLTASNCPVGITGEFATLRARATSTSALLTVTNLHTFVVGFYLRNLILSANAKHANFLKVAGGQFYDFENVYGAGSTGDGMVVAGSSGAGVYYSKFSHIRSYGAGGVGFSVKSTGSANYIASNVWDLCAAEQGSSYGMDIDWASGCYLGFEAEFNSAAAVNIDHTFDATFVGGYSEFNGGTDTSFALTANSTGVKILGGRHIGAISGTLTGVGNVLMATRSTSQLAALSMLGPLTTAASTTTASGLNLPSGTAPTSPADGDMWYDGTNVKFRVGGTTKTFTLT